MHEMQEAQHAKILGTCRALSVWAKNSMTNCKTWRSRNNGGHGLHRIGDTNGKMLVWCRKCFGYALMKLGRKLLNSCQPFVDEKKKILC